MRGVHHYRFPRIQEKENLIEPIHKLAASMYYTFSKMRFEMGSVSFIMFLRTKNTKGTISKKPYACIFYNESNILGKFTKFLNEVYPSKRPAHCILYATYPACPFLGGRPYFPTNFIGGRVPILNDIKTFKVDECLICNEKPTNILFCECGHICICDECNKTYNSSVCLICKTHSEIIRKI